MSDYERTRLVVLGGKGVGKSCIVKRFLENSYTDKYRSTVEDLYSKEFDIGHTSMKVDILDTSGEMEFPAMRRLCIANAHAFLLVYAVTSTPSFQSIKQCFEEIREQRQDVQSIPIVVAGNKLDLTPSHREVNIEDVSEWVFCEFAHLRVDILECSAKDDSNIREIFSSLLKIYKIVTEDAEDQSSSLKRTSSAYMSRKGGRKIESPALEKIKRAGSENNKSSKPRSRSMIRRTSRKAKQQLQHTRNSSEDCNVS